jgi:site-specific recombinase XerD
MRQMLRFSTLIVFIDPFYDPFRDIQQMAGHASIETTQRYIEGSTPAKRALVNLL